MKTLFVIFLCVFAVNALDLSKVRPIQDFFALNPEKYPLFNFMNKAPVSRFKDERIVGGDVAKPGQFPFQAALNVKTNNGDHFCGGSLLNKQYVITAAHCVDRAISVEVVLGAHNVRQNEKSQKRFLVPKENIKYHEKWNTNVFDNDIAVLRLPTLVKFNKHIRSIVLPRKSDRETSFIWMPCTTSGWGKDSDSITEGTSPVLRYVKTEIITNTACTNFFPDVIRPTHVCASGVGGKSACNGDSGGPLTVEYEGQTRLVGLVQFGKAFGCSIGFPHVYTRVTKYLDWIEENTNVVVEV